MDLTVKKLKEIISDLPDETILATLEYGNENFKTYSFIKRVLLLKDSATGKEYLTINSMGSHFTGKGNQSELVYMNKYWDE